MGDNAYRFVDFLQRAGQTWWQILPIGPTSYGDSPYQSFSSVAGNPYFIDLPQLERDGLLERDEYERLPWCESELSVDYGQLYQLRYEVLHHAYRRRIGRRITGASARKTGTGCRTMHCLWR